MTNPEEETERLSREEVDPGNRPPLKEGVEVETEDLLSPFVLEAACVLFSLRSFSSFFCFFFSLLAALSSGVSFSLFLCFLCFLDFLVSVFSMSLSVGSLVATAATWPPWPGLVTNSIPFCLLFTIKDQWKKCTFYKHVHNQGLC